MDMKNRMKRKILIISAFLLILAVPLAYGESEADDVLAGMEDFWSTVETFTADFRQEKKLALFSDTIHSTGTLIFQKPERMLWEYDPPDDTVMSLSPGKVMFYFPGLNQAKIFYLSGEDDPTAIAPMGFGMGGEMGDVKDRFSITVHRDESDIEVTFIPKEKGEGAGMEKVVVCVDEKYMPTATAFYETTGDVTELLFSNQEINVSLDDDVFDIELPPGTFIETIGAGE